MACSVFRVQTAFVSRWRAGRRSQRPFWGRGARLPPRHFPSRGRSSEGRSRQRARRRGPLEEGKRERPLRTEEGACVVGAAACAVSGPPTRARPLPSAGVETGRAVVQGARPRKKSLCPPGRLSPRDVCALKPERGVSLLADEDVCPPPGPEAIADAVIKDHASRPLCAQHKTVCPPAYLRAPCMCVLCDQAADADMLSEVDLMVSSSWRKRAPRYSLSASAPRNPGRRRSTRRWNSAYYSAASGGARSHRSLFGDGFQRFVRAAS